MKNHRQEQIDLLRRRVVQTIVTIPALSVIACGASADGTGATALPTTPTALDPTPACDDGDDDPTPAQTEGPYFKSSSPQRASLVEPVMAGTLL